MRGKGLPGDLYPKFKTNKKVFTSSTSAEPFLGQSGVAQREHMRSQHLVCSSLATFEVLFALAHIHGGNALCGSPQE